MSLRNMTRVFLPNDDMELDTEEYFNSVSEKEVFEFRREIEEARLSPNPLALCCECFQPVVIRGTPKRTKFFSHTKNSEDCIIKTTSQLSHEEILALKFNGQKEGALHRKLKQELADQLKSDEQFFGDVFVEKTFREENSIGIAKKWRRPDVTATFGEKERSVVFELQISTTFIDVIINRENFYHNNNAFLLWVFSSFDPDQFTTQDIAASNKSNVFVFDRNAIDASSKRGTLILTCYYRVPYETESGAILYRWDCEEVSFSDLTFDETNVKLFFKDTDVLLADLNSEISERRLREREELAAEKRAELERLEAEQRKQELYEEERIRLLQSQQFGATCSNTTSYVNHKGRGKRSFDKKIRGSYMLPVNTVSCNCGYIGKPKKLGSILLCAKCVQPIEL